jgi:hypothetical protein
VFVRRTSAEQWEFPEIAGRNTKANILYKGGARFEGIMVGMDKFWKSEADSNQKYISVRPAEECKVRMPCHVMGVHAEYVSIMNGKSAPISQKLIKREW